MTIAPGMTVKTRGKQCRVVESIPCGRGESVLRLQALDDPQFTFSVATAVETVEPVEVRPPSLDRMGRLPLFRLFHQAMFLETSGIGQETIAPFLLPAIRHEDYQLVPVKMALSLPRPRLLIADDVGLGKTIEAGLILSELHARRRANRVLIVCPASLCLQWQREMQVKFGFRFVIFNRQTLAQKRRELEAGTNPWAYEPRIITSMDFLKRPDGAFREIQGLRWDVIIVDEAHHLAPSGAAESDKQLTRLGRFLAEASDALLLLTATPHNGYDESMATLLSFLDPSLVSGEKKLVPSRYRRHYIRRLKNHIRNPDGSPKFVERKPVQPLQVKLSPDEKKFHEQVRSYAQQILALAEKAEPKDRQAIQFVATVLCKRAVSSRRALLETLKRRLERLQEKQEEVEAERELLRRWRRGEPLSPDELQKLEQDAYINYLSAMRRLRKELARLEDEEDTVRSLLSALQELEKSSPDPKLVRLLDWLRQLHQSQPDLKVIVFTEYVDTVRAIEEFLKANGYEGKVVTATGEDPDADQRSAINTFLFGDATVLVATDIAGEGLNLHYNCHHLVHFELPWNPNRLEQRNGRIDRYGQTKSPVIAFLYLADTYEDEVLRRLLEKLDNKLRAEGTITDILGSFQQERLERLLLSRRKVEEAEKELDEMLKTVVPKEVLSEGTDDWLLSSIRSVLPSPQLEFDLVTFLQDSVKVAGGNWEEKGNGLVSIQVPKSWQAYLPHGQQSDVWELFVRDIPDNPNIPPEKILHPNHPLVQACLHWFHHLRFDPKEEVRIAYQVSEEVSEPEMIVTFLISLQDRAGSVTTLLEPVRVGRSFTSGDEKGDREIFYAAIKKPGGNVPTETLQGLFADWWLEGRERAKETAKVRAKSYSQILKGVRENLWRQMQGEIQAWAEENEKAILGDLWKEYQQRRLFGEPMEDRLPPPVRKRLQHHREQVRRLRQFWEQWTKIEEPIVEELGILLRVPKNSVAEG